MALSTSFGSTAVSLSKSRPPQAEDMSSLTARSEKIEMARSKNRCEFFNTDQDNTMLWQLQACIEEEFQVMCEKLLMEIRDLLPQASTQKSASILEPCVMQESNASPVHHVNPRVTVSRQESADSNQSKISATASEEPPREPPQPHFSYADDFTDLRNRIVDDVAVAERNFFTWIHDLTYALQKRRWQAERHWSGHDCLRRVVLSRSFTSLSILVITLNAVWMGYSIDVELGQRINSEDGHAVEATWHHMTTMFFSSFFLLEVILKILAFQQYFFICEEWRWNIFDMVLVATSVSDFFTSGANLTFLKMLRLFKLMKALRLARLMRFVSSLREMMLTFLDTLGALFWSLVAILMVTYMSAILFSQACSMLLEQNTPPGDKVLSSFLSVGQSMVTLFSVITSGQDWYDLVEDFHGKHVISVCAQYGFGLYIFFMQFGFVNVIVGVFCTKAHEATASDEDLKMHKQEKRYAQIVQKVINLFHEMNAKRDGEICEEQFHTYVQSPDAIALHGMPGFQGLQFFDHGKLWQVLLSCSGCPGETVDLPGFVVAVLRMTGDAPCTEAVMLSHDLGKITDSTSRIHAHTTEIHEHTSRIREHTQKIKVHTSEIHGHHFPHGLHPQVAAAIKQGFETTHMEDGSITSLKTI